MVTSCYRRLGDLYRALELYQKIHEDHPENIESLQYLEALCKDLGRPHEDYTRKLDKLRRALPANTQSGAMTRAGAPTHGDGAPAPQRTERPKSLKAVATDKLSSNVLDNGNNGMTAPRAGSAAVVRNNTMKQTKAEEDDDFGDTDVSDLLG
jgi:tetratricopeptide (TPR) repeat protein